MDTSGRFSPAALHRAARHVIALVLLLSALLTGCAGDEQTSPAPNVIVAGAPATTASPATTAPTLVPTATPSPLPPTPTPQLAAMVNGQPILLSEFDDELARYQIAQQELGLDPGADGIDPRQLVLDALIERELLRQAAELQGITVTPEMVADRLQQLQLAAEEHGGFDAWLVANKWTLDAFRSALATEMMVETMIAQLATTVPYTAEQVRARYIQVDDAALADSLLTQIRDGVDFGELAAAHSRDLITAPAGGDLGYFARGSLLVPEVEDAAFDLQAEQVSDVISVPDEESGRIIHYIVQVTERDPARPLNSDLRHQLLQEAYDAWLAQQLDSATVVSFLDS